MISPNRCCTIRMISANNTPLQNACSYTGLQVAVASISESRPRLIRSRSKRLPRVKMIMTAQATWQTAREGRWSEAGVAGWWGWGWLSNASCGRVVLESSGIVARSTRSAPCWKLAVKLGCGSNKSILYFTKSTLWYLCTAEKHRAGSIFKNDKNVDSPSDH